MINRENLIDIFKALSDPTRLRMFRLLTANRAELCVCEFVDALQERQYNVSKHLKLLENSGLIEGVKEGRFVYYSLTKGNDVTRKVLHKLIAAVPDSGKTFTKDQARFEERMLLREGGRCQIGIQTKKLAE